MAWAGGDDRRSRCRPLLAYRPRCGRHLARLGRCGQRGPTFPCRIYRKHGRHRRPLNLQRAVNRRTAGCSQRPAKSRAPEEQHHVQGAASPAQSQQGRPGPIWAGRARSKGLPGIPARRMMRCPPKGHPSARRRLASPIEAGPVGLASAPEQGSKISPDPIWTEARSMRCALPAKDQSAAQGGIARLSDQAAIMPQSLSGIMMFSDRAFGS